MSTSMDTEIAKRLTRRTTKCLVVMFMSHQLVKISEIAPQMQDCDFPLKPVKTNKKEKVVN